jgi:hypothetical protein
MAKLSGVVFQNFPRKNKLHTDILGEKIFGEFSLKFSRKIPKRTCTQNRRHKVLYIPVQKCKFNDDDFSNVQVEMHPPTYV